MSLKEMLNNVESRADLVIFVRALQSDLEARPGEWANKSLGDFLESLSGWMEDMEGFYENSGRPTPSSPSWLTVAEMLLAAKYYE